MRIRVAFFATLLIISTLGLSIILAAQGEPMWPRFKFDQQNTGRSPYLGPSNPEKLWMFPMGNLANSTPTLGYDGIIYIGSRDKNLYAITPNGERVWRCFLDGQVYSSTLLGNDGTIYVGSTSEKLHAVNSDGTPKWDIVIGLNTFSSPNMGDDGTIYIGTTTGYLWAVDQNGQEKWHINLGELSYSSPAIGNDGTIYVGSQARKKLYAINEDGTIQWEAATNSGIQSSPVIGDDGTIYVGDLGGNFYAFSSDGQIKWQFKTGRAIISAPAIGWDGTIYLGSYDTYLYAIDSSGTEKWRFKTGDVIVSSPIIDPSGTIYFGSFDKNIYALNSQDGSLKWKYETLGKINGTPVISSDGNLYITSSDAWALYALADPKIPPQITIELPASLLNDGIVMGKVLIGWTATDPDGNHEDVRVNLYFSSDNGGTYLRIAEDLESAGTFLWEMPEDLDGGKLCRFKVEAVDKDGLISTDESIPFITIKSEKRLVAGPNPASEYINFYYDIEGEGELRIFNIYGQCVFKQHVYSDSNQYVWELIDNSGVLVGSGLYFYSLWHKGMLLSGPEKLIIKR